MILIIFIFSFLGLSIILDRRPPAQAVGSRHTIKEPRWPSGYSAPRFTAPGRVRSRRRGLHRNLSWSAEHPFDQLDGNTPSSSPGSHQAAQGSAHRGPWPAKRRSRRFNAQCAKSFRRGIPRCGGTLRIRDLIRRLLFGGILFLGLPLAADNNSLTDAQLLQIKFEQKLNSQVSADLVFRDETGKPIRLGDYFGKRPLVLVLGYYGCPMLCTLVLNGVTESLRDLKWSAGKQFDVIFASIDPSESPQLAAAKKHTYLRDYGRPGSDPGWHFLVAASPSTVGASLPDQSIQTLADEIGFRYAYDAGLKQFAHPSGFVVLTREGKVAHYFLGVTFSPNEVDAALREASVNKIGSPVRELILLCCEYSPLRGRYGNLVMDLVRAGGVATVLALGIYFIRPKRGKCRARLSPAPPALQRERGVGFTDAGGPDAGAGLRGKSEAPR